MRGKASVKCRQSKTSFSSTSCDFRARNFAPEMLFFTQAGNLRDYLGELIENWCAELE